MDKKNIKQPKLGKYIIQKSVYQENVPGLMGDFEEEYLLRIKDKGIFLGWLWYWFQVLKSFPSFLVDKFNWSFAMLKNYLKSAFRNMKKQKVFSVINILGLSIGLTCCILIYLHISNELSYDRFHEHGERIYRILMVRFEPDGSINRKSILTPAAMGADLKNSFPEIEHSIRLTPRSIVLKYDDKIERERMVFVDKDFFEVFSFKLLKGDPQSVLANNNGIVLTESIALKYFGTENPLNKTMNVIFEDKKFDVVVTGIAADFPKNSTSRYNIFLNFDNLKTLEPRLTSSLGAATTRNYVMLKKNTRAESINTKFSKFTDDYFSSVIKSWRDRGYWKGKGKPFTFELQNIKDIHLTPGIRGGTSPDNLYILSGIALIVLVIACINFMNLSIGRASGRFLEVGLRKIIGAQRKQLIAQFWIESIVLTLFAVFIGIILAAFILPAYNTLTENTFTISDFTKANHLLGFFVLIAFVGIITGSYPSLVMSGFRPVEILKGNLRLGTKKILTRFLVILQFGLSAFLIISTIVLSSQINFMLNKDLGYDKEGLIIINMQRVGGEEVKRIKNIFKNELKGHPDIENITATSISYGQDLAATEFPVKGKNIEAAIYTIDYDYVTTLGLRLTEGRDYTPEYASEGSKVAIVNETFVNETGLDNPIGQEMKGIRIIGVVKDFNFESLHKRVGPAVMSPASFIPINSMVIRINQKNPIGTLSLLENTWKKIQPDKPFIYSLQNDVLESQYIIEKRWQTIIQYSSVFAILIACMGIFGLISITVTKRIKEIGIRKVLGARVSQIINLVLREYILIVIVANLISWPLAYYAMKKMLDNYFYRIELGIVYFIVAGVFSLLIAVITISYIAVKAATSNPVKSLRYE